MDFEKEYNIGEERIWKSQRFDYFLMHSMIYKLSVLKKCQLKMTEGICFTDAEYLIYPANHVSSIIFLKDVLYNYDLAREGQSMDTKAALKNSRDMKIVITKMVPHFNQFNNFAAFVTTNLLVLYYYRMLFLCISDSELKEVDILLRKCKPVFFKNLNKALLGAPRLWRLFGIHFLFYEKLKRLFHVER